MLEQPLPQEYDTTLKSLFGEEAAKIVPMLVPGTQWIDEKNIELDRSTLKADLVYNVIVEGIPAIMNTELQTDIKTNIVVRLLQYHVLILAKHKKPVFSVLLLPFKAYFSPELESPFEERCGDNVLLTFRYEVVKLWERDADMYVRHRAVHMYTFLPCMRNATADLLIRAIWEMDEYYTREDLRRHLVRFLSFLKKTPMVSDEDKQKVEEVLHMQYGRDWLIETLPEVIELVEKGEARGEARGEVRGELVGLGKMAVDVTQVRFPMLLTLVQKRAEQITDPATLRKLILDIMNAPDEAAARYILSKDNDA